MVPTTYLKLTIKSAATPDVVRQIAEMYAETLGQISADIVEGEVTLVVNNYNTESFLRGWSGAGATAIDDLGRLIRNPSEAIRKTPRLADAAQTLGPYVKRLQSYGAELRHRRYKAVPIDADLVRELNTVSSGIVLSPGSLRGETLVYSKVFRVGRKSEGGSLRARIRVDGRPIDVDVEPSLETILWDVAKTARETNLRLSGRWQKQGGSLALVRPRIIAVDKNFQLWTGEKLLAEAEKHADMFTEDDFDEMMADLQD